MLSNKVREIMTRDLITASATSAISDVMEMMAAKNVGRVIVTEDDIPVGIFTEKDVLKRVINQNLDTKKTSIKKVMTSPARAVAQETRIVDALGRMYRAKFRHLLVRDDKRKIAGMISMRRILKLAVELGRGLPDTQTVGSIMSRDVLTVDAGDTIAEAIKLMTKKETGCVVVLSRGKPTGIFTERDVLQRVATKTIDISKTPVQKVMTTDPIALPETALIGRVLEELYKRNFRHLLILGEDQKLLGIVSMRDVLKYARALDIDDNVRTTWKEIEAFWDSEEHYTPG